MTNDIATLLAGAARTATPAIIVRRNLRFRGVLFTVHVSAHSGAATLTPEILVPNSAEDYTIHSYWIATAAIGTTGAFEYLLYPAAVNGNVTEVDAVPLPTQWGFRMNHGTADSITYDCVAQYLR